MFSWSRKLASHAALLAPLRGRFVAGAGPSHARLFSSATKRPTQAYNDMVRQGLIQYDAQQVKLLAPLDALHKDMHGYVPAGAAQASSSSSTATTQQSGESSASSGGGWFSSMFSSSKAASPAASPPQTTAPPTSTAAATSSGAPPKGVYMYGGVGCGKSMLMDLFYDCCEGVVEKRRRVHFHSFMLEVHRKMHELKQSGHHGDPLPQLVDDYLQEATLLCFDEFQVTDVADALIMRRLFGGLIDKGMIMVSTSNREPDALYYNGIQRHLFLPFIEYLKQVCTVVCLDSDVDYRLFEFFFGSGDGKVFLTPDAYNGVSKRDTAFRDLHSSLVEGVPRKPVTLNVQGRAWTIQDACETKGVARLSFDDLCLQPRGAIDYIALCDKFHTLFIEGIPRLSLSNEFNAIRRLINLIDVCYEAKAKIVCTAAASPEALIVDEGGVAGDESFAFDRTVSRLREMQSQLYLKSHVKLAS